MRIALQLRGNHGAGVVRVCADGGPDIAKPALASSTPSAIGFQMTNFQRKPISQEAGRTLPVRFDTADLSGLYPFATASAHHCNDFPRRVNAVTSGVAGRRVLARRVSTR
jgi:hypothetical protein